MDDRRSGATARRSRRGPGAALRVTAVDESGSRSAEKRKLWLCELAGERPVRLEAGRSCEELITHLIEEADRDPRLVVGLDFAFSFPAWYFRRHRMKRPEEAWALAARRGEKWLSSCSPPFWGRSGSPKTLTPERLYRKTEEETAAAGHGRPKSIFQIGGAGAVGAGSLRGMPCLPRLRQAGFSLWPFDPARLPCLLEINPRALTGAVRKSDPEARSAYLERRYALLPKRPLDAARGSDDAFDALASALVMAAGIRAIEDLPRRDAASRLEGSIWLPPPSPQQRRQRP